MEDVKTESEGVTETETEEGKGDMSNTKTNGAAAQREMPLFDPEQLTIVTDEKHPLWDERVKMKLDEHLVKSIMFYGVTQPIIVRRNGEDKKGRPIIEVVDGRQRVKACIEANKRLKAKGSVTHRIPATTRTGEDKELMGVMVTTNEIRKGDAMITQAKKAQRLLEAGQTEAEVALSFGVTTATIKNFLQLLQCAKPIQNAVSSGALSADIAKTLGKLPREEQLSAFADLEKQGKKGMKGKKAKKRLEKSTGGKVKSDHTMSKKDLKNLYDDLVMTARATKGDKATDELYAFGIKLLKHCLGHLAKPPFEVTDGRNDEEEVKPAKKSASAAPKKRRKTSNNHVAAEAVA